MVDVYVTDIPFSSLNKGDIVESVKGIRGFITNLSLELDEYLDTQMVLINILWDDNSPGSRRYHYGDLGIVKYIGRSTDLGDGVLCGFRPVRWETCLADTLLAKCSMDILSITNLLDRAARVVENPNLESDEEKRELVESLRNISSAIAAEDIPQFVRDLKIQRTDNNSVSGVTELEESQWFDPIYESISEMIVSKPRQLPPTIDRLRVGSDYKLRHGRIVRLVQTIGTVVSTGLPASFQTREGEFFCINGANASYVGDDIMELVVKL